MSIYDTIKAAHGDGPAYPNRADFTTIFGYSKGTCLGTFADAAVAKAAGATTTEESIDEVAYKVAMDAYRAHGAAIINEWIATIRQNYPVNDATWNAIYGLAYDDGHSYGYSEVEIYIDEYYEFAMTVISANKEK